MPEGTTLISFSPQEAHDGSHRKVLDSANRKCMFLRFGDRLLCDRMDINVIQLKTGQIISHSPASRDPVFLPELNS